jgi:hypothetical protein
MTPRWDPCVSYDGQRAEEFLATFFADASRRVLVIGAAGFDHRSSSISAIVSRVAANRMRGVFIREQRPEPSEQIAELAEANEAALRGLCKSAEIVNVDVFDGRDSAVVAGSQAVKLVGRQIALDEVTDVMIDVSALSIGISFPLVRALFERARAQHDRKINIHVLLMSDGASDEDVEREFIDKVATVQGFAGQLGLTARRDKIARLWVPQLSSRKRPATRLIYQHLTERAPLLDVCPLIPFPSINPRRGDELAIEYIEELEGAWAVDERNLIAVAEEDPLDVYRVLLRLDDTRREVFRALGDSEIVLSPIGPKAMALGCLLAAIERDMPVVYVETLRYGEPQIGPPRPSSGRLLYFWLYGEAYGNT